MSTAFAWKESWQTLTDWTWVLVVLKQRVASLSLQTYNWRIAMKRLIPMLTISYLFCYTPGDAAHSGLCPHWTTSSVTTMSLSALYHSWAHGCHRSCIWLSHPEDCSLFHVAMRMGAQCFLWDEFEKTLIKNNAPYTHLLDASAKYFSWMKHRNTQLIKTCNIDDAMRFFQIRDLVMFGYVCPSHFKPRL